MVSPSTKDQILGLDHLRALAALMVFFWHGLHARGIPTTEVPSWPILSIFEEGYIGVSLFITITGFIFTILTHGKEIDFFSFMKNRLLRLFPLIFLVLMFAAQIGKTPRDSVFQFFNLLGAGAPYGMWTLVVEFQFYIAYPFIRGALTKGRWYEVVLRCGAFVGVFVFLRASNFATQSQAQDITYWTIFGRVDEFVAGILAGLVYLHFRNGVTIRVRLAAVVATAASFAAVAAVQHWFNVQGGFYHQPEYPSPKAIWIIWPTVNAPLWGALICSYCLLTRGASGRIASSFAYIGKISYSIYMLHFLTLPLCYYLYDTFVVMPLSDDANWNAVLTVGFLFLPFTLIVSAMSYELIETPFLRRKVRYTKPVVATPVG